MIFGRMQVAERGAGEEQRDAAARKPSAYRFSFRCRPGVTKRPQLVEPDRRRDEDAGGDRAP